MPPNRNSVPQVVRRRTAAVSEPPEVMTWSKAMPVLIVAGVFDALRMFFEMCLCFGPALGAVVCTVAGSTTYLGQLVGPGTTGAVCAVIAGTVGFVGSVPIEAFGIIMSEALGLLGFLTLGLWIVMRNPRLFKAQATGLIWFMGSFAMSEIPIIGTIPAFTIAIYRLYRTQIKVEKAALKKFEEQQAATQLQERNQQQAQRVQYQVAQQAQFAQQEAVNDEEYNVEEIPDEVRRAA